jgi:Helix-turn-helix domain
VKSFHSQTLYEVLEISVSSTPHEIRAAYDRLDRLYGTEQMALYGLVDSSNTDALRAKLRLALETLTNDDARNLYDVSIGLPPQDMVPHHRTVAYEPAAAWGERVVESAKVAPLEKPIVLTQVVSPAKPVESAEQKPSVPDQNTILESSPVQQSELRNEPAPYVVEAPTPVEYSISTLAPMRSMSREFRIEPLHRPYEVPEGVEFNGDLLRQVRMAKGLSMIQVSERTKISVKHLENVESDRYDGLPATVYLRGILMSLARELGLDGMRVTRSYLSFVEAHRSKG